MILSKSSNWKGKKATYCAKHRWIYYWFGKASKCEHCGTLKALKYEWANISGKYNRNITDYKQLCTKCHKIFDYKTHCKYGHKFVKNSFTMYGGRRICKQCHSKRTRDYKKRLQNKIKQNEFHNN